MMHKELLNLNVSKLKKCAPEKLQQQSVAAVLLALGSNYQAEHYLPRVRKQLAALGEVKLSTAFQNPDFTAISGQPKPDYTNQCIHLSLTPPVPLQQLQQTFKKFESGCDRCRQIESTAIRQVTMDIDILLVKLKAKNDGNDDEWIIMANRYPFRAHERAGVEELVAKNSFNF